MSELQPPAEPSDKAEKESRSKRRHNWGRMGAIAGVAGAIISGVALYPSYAPLISSASSHNERMYDGPIAQIAIREKGWDARGFTPDGLTSTADQVNYFFAGHYMDPQTGDANPANDVCEVTLHANPSTSYPYGGQSGFVYLQSGTADHPDSKILYNPTLDEIYTTKLDFHEFVPAKCWPGHFTFPSTG